MSSAQPASSQQAPSNQQQQAVRQQQQPPSQAAAGSPGRRSSSGGAAGPRALEVPNATPSPSRKQQFTWVPHPPPLLGTSPSGSSGALSGSFSGSLGGSGALQQQMQLPPRGTSPTSSGLLPAVSASAAAGAGAPCAPAPTAAAVAQQLSGLSVAQRSGSTGAGLSGISRSSSAAADVLGAGSGLLLRDDGELAVSDGEDADGALLPPRTRRCPFVIGVAGGTASGKTTVCDTIVQRLHDQCVVMLNQDSFYRSLTAVRGRGLCVCVCVCVCVLGVVAWLCWWCLLARVQVLCCLGCGGCGTSVGGPARPCSHRCLHTLAAGATGHPTPPHATRRRRPSWQMSKTTTLTRPPRLTRRRCWSASRSSRRGTPWRCPRTTSAGTRAARRPSGCVRAVVGCVDA
jgi:hypothetical protein